MNPRQSFGAWAAVIGFATALPSFFVALSQAPLILGGQSIKLPHLGWPSLDFSKLVQALNGIDPLGFVAVNKFGVTATCGLACIILYMITHRARAFSQAGVGGIIIAFLAGASIPAGLIFGLVAFYPDRLNILLDFREFVLVSGISLVVISIVGIRGILSQDLE